VCRSLCIRSSVYRRDLYGLYMSRSLCIRDRILSSCVISVRLFVYGLRVRSYTSRSLYRRDPYGLRCTTLRSVRSSAYRRDPYGLWCEVAIDTSLCIRSSCVISRVFVMLV